MNVPTYTMIYSISSLRRVACFAFRSTTTTEILADAGEKETRGAYHDVLCRFGTGYRYFEIAHRCGFRNSGAAAMALRAACSRIKLKVCNTTETHCAATLSHHPGIYSRVLPVFTSRLEPKIYWGGTNQRFLNPL